MCVPQLARILRSHTTSTSVGVSALSLSAPAQPASPENESDSTDSDTQPRPRKQRKKVGKYNPPLTSEQRLDILRLHVSEGKTAPTIARLYKDRGFTVHGSSHSAQLSNAALALS